MQSLTRTHKHVEHSTSQRWVVVTTFLVFVLFAVFSVRWDWQWLAPVGEKHEDRPILSADHFGDATDFGRAPNVIPLRSLNLVLAGVITTPTGSFALIRVNGGPETLYTTEQEIASGATLHAVYSDRVLLRRGGETESLILQSGTPAAPGTVTPVGPKPELLTMTELNNNSAPHPKSTPARQALMVPNVGGGLLVNKVRPGSLYRKIGLRAGDVINSVNGRSVNSVDDVADLYQQLQDNPTNQISIDIRRAEENLILR